MSVGAATESYFFGVTRFVGLKMFSLFLTRVRNLKSIQQTLWFRIRNEKTYTTMRFEEYATRIHIKY